MKYYVDVDGTLIKAMDSSNLREWTRKVMHKHNPLNLQLLRWLKDRKAEGHTLYLWTDRNAELEIYTMRNLGKWGNLFDGAFFNGDNGLGGKFTGKVDGFVIDDKERFVKCGTKGGMVIDWK
jgi:hypothetical protein